MRTERMGTDKTMLVVALAALPFAAYAGLPSIYTVMFFRATFGSLVIGFIEGLILWRCCAKEKRGCFTSLLCVLLMVFANFLSIVALAGLRNSLLAEIILQAGIEHLKLLFFCGVALAFLLKAVVEFPFVCSALYFCGRDRFWRNTLRALLLTQSVSFVLLALMYSALCDWSLLAVSVVDAGKIELPDGLVVRYVAEDGTGKSLNVRTRQTADFDADAIRKASRRYAPEEVFFVGGTNRVWDADVISHDGGGFNETILCRNRQTGRDYRIGLQTPLLCWYIEDVTMLADGKVVFGLDSGEIVVADPERNQMAVLAHGEHPAVVVSRRIW